MWTLFLSSRAFYGRCDFAKVCIFRIGISMYYFLGRFSYLYWASPSSVSTLIKDLGLWRNRLKARLILERPLTMATVLGWPVAEAVCPFDLEEGLGVCSLELLECTVDMDELLPSPASEDEVIPNSASIRPEVDLPRLRERGVSSGVWSISWKANKLDLTVTDKWHTPLRISTARAYFVPCSKLCPFTSRICRSV